MDRDNFLFVPLKHFIQAEAGWSKNTLGQDTNYRKAFKVVKERKKLNFVLF